MTIELTRHKIILIRILKEIYSNPITGPVLGFKGGTAAFLFYHLERFSVDLDFDLLDLSKVDNIFQQMQSILIKYGRLKVADKKRYSLIFILEYNDKEPGEQNVKVEINLRDFGSKFTIQAYLGISMKVMIREDMIAHKLVALYERVGKTNRDLYDCWFFLSQGWPINRNIIENRTGINFHQFVTNCLLIIEKTSNRNILSGMGELLDQKQKNWVKNHLKEELVFQLKLLGVE